VHKVVVKRTQISRSMRSISHSGGFVRALPERAKAHRVAIGVPFIIRWENASRPSADCRKNVGRAAPYRIGGDKRTRNVRRGASAGGADRAVNGALPRRGFQDFAQATVTFRRKTKSGRPTTIRTSLKST